MSEENSGRLAAKANELYWQTSRPAGRLADELGISRSKFYALVEPLRIEIMCSACGAPLAFSSRSDRDSGRGQCSECGAAETVPADHIPAPPLHAEVADQPARSETGLTSWIELPGNRDLWLSALAGVAAGLLISTLWRRR
jgi:hypothetical protein